MDALKVENLSKSFGGLGVLADVSFALKPGERWAMIGPNGAGKTTLLNILSGVLPPTGGRVQFFGHDITRLNIHERLRLGLSRSFQLNSLFPKSTVLDNVTLALQGNNNLNGQLINRIGKNDPQFVRMQELMNSVGLWEKRNHLVNSLSYGEQRQMEIALSLASEPKILLLDEPSAGLSTAESAKMVETVRRLTEGSTLLFCAHDMDVVFTLAEKIMVLYSGRIATQGSCAEIQCDSLVREIYLGK